MNSNHIDFCKRSTEIYETDPDLDNTEYKLSPLGKIDVVICQTCIDLEIQGLIHNTQIKINEKQEKLNEISSEPYATTKKNESCLSSFIHSSLILAFSQGALFFIAFQVFGLQMPNEILIKIGAAEVLLMALLASVTSQVEHNSLKNNYKKEIDIEKEKTVSSYYSEFKIGEQIAEKIAKRHIPYVQVKPKPFSNQMPQIGIRLESAPLTWKIFH